MLPPSQKAAAVGGTYLPDPSVLVQNCRFGQADLCSQPGGLGSLSSLQSLRSQMYLFFLLFVFQKTSDPTVVAYLSHPLTHAGNLAQFPFLIVHTTTSFFFPRNLSAFRGLSSNWQTQEITHQSHRSDGEVSLPSSPPFIPATVIGRSRFSVRHCSHTSYCHSASTHWPSLEPMREGTRRCSHTVDQTRF